MNDNHKKNLLMTHIELDLKANGNISKNSNIPEVNFVKQVEINLESNINYQHYAELREQQLRVRETGLKPMY